MNRRILRNLAFLGLMVLAFLAVPSTEVTASCCTDGCTYWYQHYCLPGCNGNPTCESNCWSGWQNCLILVCGGGGNPGPGC
jgi:hypothetical protein